MKNKIIIQLLQTTLNNKSGILYCGTIENVLYCQQLLQNNNINCTIYHAKLNNEDKERNFQLWKTNETKIVASTIALGMGIDKLNTQFIIHTDVSNSLCNYIQESGRVGRNGDISDCILLYNPLDVFKKMNLIFKSQNYPINVKLQQVNNLCATLNYCENMTVCRYKILLSFYDNNAFVQMDNNIDINNPEWKCLKCDICLNAFRKSYVNVKNITIEICQSILHFQTRQEKITLSNIISFYKGKCTANIIINDLFKNEHFGILCSWSDKQVKRLLITILSQKLIKLSHIDNFNDNENNPVIEGNYYSTFFQLNINDLNEIRNMNVSNIMLS